MEVETVEIVYGPRDETFKLMIQTVLSKSKLKQKYIDLLLDEESLRLYGNAFTNAIADPVNNYEFYEILGDATVNKSMVWYLFRRFPELNCVEGGGILSRLKQQLVAKESFSNLAYGIKFWDFVTVDKKSKEMNRKKILEDVFEAFFGVTEYILDTRIKLGVGSVICYQILETLMDGIQISTRYEYLYDAKTRLKEIFDYAVSRKNGIGKFRYDTLPRQEDIAGYNVNLVRIAPDGSEQLIGRGFAMLKQDAEKRAAEEGIATLKRMGFWKPVPEIYKKFEKRN